MPEYVTHGDCVPLMAAMPNGSVDAVITDIPYNEVNERETAGGAGIRDLTKGAADASKVDLSWLVAEFARVSRGSVYVFCGYAQVSPLIVGFRSLGLSVRLGGWVKTDPPPLNGESLWVSAFEACVFARKAGAPFFRFCKPPIWTGPRERNIDWHPTPKPVWLMRELVTASVPIGGTVLDPFTGSGAAGEAAVSESRRFIGYELNAEWARKANDRIRATPVSLLPDAGTHRSRPTDSAVPDLFDGAA